MLTEGNMTDIIIIIVDIIVIIFKTPYKRNKS